MEANKDKNQDYTYRSSEIAKTSTDREVSRKIESPDFDQSYGEQNGRGWDDQVSVLDAVEGPTDSYRDQSLTQTSRPTKKLVKGPAIGEDDAP